VSFHDGASDSGLARATHLLAMGRAADALPLAEQAVLADPHDVEALGTLARCHLAQRDHEKAQEAARRAVAASPEDPWPHRLLATALSGSGRRKDAVRAQAEAVRLEPGSAHALAELATLLADDRQRRAALEAIERARAIQPDDPLVAIGESYVALAARRWADAEAAARRALAADPESTDAMNNLGVALERQGRRAEALDLYARASGSDPGGVGADNARATAKRIAGVGGITAIGVGAFVGIRQIGTAAFEALPGSAKGPILALAVIAVIAVIVAEERRRRRERAALSDHGRRIVDDAKRTELQRRRLEMRRLEPVFTMALVGCVVVSVAALAWGGSDAMPLVVILAILALITAGSIAAGRMAEDEQN
jgi:tetratricopeptide (TPR) repeat protein